MQPSLTSLGIATSPVMSPNLQTDAFKEIRDGRYVVRFANGWSEVESALRLRHEVFNVELGNLGDTTDHAGLEFDAYDLKCRHLLVIERETGSTVGTYRLNSIESAGSICGFYSSNEFTIEDLPAEVPQNGIEIGRACVAKEHRNSKVLFLLLKALFAHLEQSGKQYFFGCCSIFTRDPDNGRRAFSQLFSEGYLDDRLSVEPCRNGLFNFNDDDGGQRVDLPNLFNMYLRIGAKVCGPPMIDYEFGTIDFFVVFDVRNMNPKYRKLFACAIR